MCTCDCPKQTEILVKGRIPLIKSIGEFLEFDEKKRIVTGVVSTDMVDEHGHRIPIDELVKIAEILVERQTPICKNHTSGSNGKLIDYHRAEHEGKDALFIKIKVFDHFRSDHQFWNEIITGELKQFSLRGSGFVKTKCDTSKCWKEARDIEVLEISAVKKGANPGADILVPIKKEGEENMPDNGENTPPQDQGELLIGLQKSITDLVVGQSEFQKTVSDQLTGMNTRFVDLENKVNEQLTKMHHDTTGGTEEDQRADPTGSEGSSEDVSSSSGTSDEIVEVVKGLIGGLKEELAEFKEKVAVNSFQTPGAGSTSGSAVSDTNSVEKAYLELKKQALMTGELPPEDVIIGSLK